MGGQYWRSLELPYRHSNGEVRASLFRIASAFFDHSMKGGLSVIDDAVDPGHCQRDTGTIQSYSESQLSTYVVRSTLYSTCDRS